MAAPDLAGIAEHLLREFMAPLVLGGPMSPGRPIGAKVALSIGEQRVAGDADLWSTIELARVRVARTLVPIDRLGEATPAEWALSAALHDIVQSTHPNLGGAFTGRAPGRLLNLVLATLERVSDVASLAEAVSRHAWFSRLFEIARNDTVVSWWVGSRTFLGEDPPERLLSWPDLRRVRTTKSTHPLLELPAHGGRVEPVRVADAVTAFLAKTPLTDFANAARTVPLFAFTKSNIALVATPFGRTLARHALGRGDELMTNRALGRATRALFVSRAYGAANIASELLGERMLMEALASQAAASNPGTDPGADASFARAVGALAAKAALARGEVALRDGERRRVLQFLEGPASSKEGQALAAAMASSPSSAS